MFASPVRSTTARGNIAALCVLQSGFMKIALPELWFLMKAGAEVALVRRVIVQIIGRQCEIASKSLAVQVRFD